MDYLVGDAFKAADTPTCGNDKLYGGAGDDLLVGDLFDLGHSSGDPAFGRDTFVFAPGSGQDVILDFQHGLDKMRLSTAFGAIKFADLTITDDDGDAIVELSADHQDEVMLLGVAPGDLTARDFQFVA